MKVTIVFLVAIAMIGCTPKDKYDPAQLGAAGRDSVLTGIISYVYTAPVYTAMKDRFKHEHRGYYASLLSKFSLVRYYKGDNGVHYFYVIRPGAKIGDQRGVGGSFKMDDHFNFTKFREVFVTPMLSDAELKSKGFFLFDEMVQDKIGPDLKMKSYVQWPNSITVYDTLLYQWKLNSDSIK